MTKDEIIERNDQSRETAMREARHRVAGLTARMFIDDNDITHSVAEDILECLRNLTSAAAEGRLHCRRLEHADRFAQLLETSGFYEWYELLPETEHDPVSGNSRHKTVRHVEGLGEITLVAHDVRCELPKCVRNLAALAKRNEALAYPKLRDLYVTISERCRDANALNALDEDFAEYVADTLGRLLVELDADLDIAKVKIVRKVAKKKGGRR